MSFYATIEGAVHYDDEAPFQTAIGSLQRDGWLDKQDCLVDEQGARLTEERPNVDRDNRRIELPRFLYRNLARELEGLFAGSQGTIVWASTDGCFDGGVIVDGMETTYDLAAWNTERNGPLAPDPDANFDTYCEWQGDVEEAFFDEFTS